MLPALLRLSLRRALLALPLVLAVIAFTFFLIRLAPGDPAAILAGEAPTPEFLAQVRAEYGLDQPAWRQFVAFLGKAMTGDFGTSIYSKQPVFTVILERFPATVLLTGTAMVIASLIGILLGAASARRAGSRADALISAASLVGYSLPGFWVGQLLILLFAVSLNWLPAGGMVAARGSYTGWRHVEDVAFHMVLPVATLAVFLLTMIARFTRAAMVEALDQDYVLVAEAKGASRRRVLWNHAFRNAAVTTVTVIGLEFGMVLAGAVVVEIVFSWPGLGRLFYDAIHRRDFALLTGAFMFSSLVVIVVNMVSDIGCAMLDPRIRR
ncbi:ABC transporter permease [Reyranella soli]|uniref:Peptide ABC transporter permease n=1 Tax=Reyranella soli TaxID=1230389 RepID=A0A512NJM7_9HYPH|nr:ABC transporter permease [Reyranella soli]GEP59153.1 peptide ABC transporter permease [Reyranella soli]